MPCLSWANLSGRQIYVTAFYQLACAYTAMNHFEEAVRYLAEALARTETYRDEITLDPALKPLEDFAPFKALLRGESSTE